MSVIPLLLDKQAAADRQREVEAALSRAIAEGLDISNIEEVRLVVENSRQSKVDNGGR